MALSGIYHCNGSHKCFPLNLGYAYTVSVLKIHESQPSSKRPKCKPPHIIKNNLDFLLF